SLLCSISNREEERGKRLMFLIALFDQVYWVLGSVIGATLGMLITFQTKGIDFAMTALFTVILIEQWIAAKRHVSIVCALIAVGVSAVCFGLENFLLPALILLVVLLIIFRKNVEGGEAL
ncbi:MAG: branched-chain amino acid transporter AzlC, partial [Longicatena sp.]